MLTINIRSADERIETVPFESDEVTIGRDDGCGITLPDRNISRTHAKLTRRQDGVFLEDLESSFGTLLNDTRIESGREVRVRPGDLLQLGYYVIQIEGIDSDATLSATVEDDLIVEFESAADDGDKPTLEVEVVNADTDPVGYPVHKVTTSVATPVSATLDEPPPLVDASFDDEWDDEKESRSRGSLGKTLFFLVLVLAVVAGLVYFVATNLLTEETLDASRPTFIQQPQDDAPPTKQ